ncbi:hypothetical protein [Mycoplasma leachii]|uniref:hypothetical protein n=1 Tax=Mycoplasma leachii TaxID=2105 RepID=UPI000D1F5647|nr:hypothetical protein [Mycoplasma leachii]
MLQTSFRKDAQKRILELEEKILKIFNESDFDQIKKEIILLFSEVYEESDPSSENVKKKISDILSRVDKKNRRDIPEIVNDLLSEILEKQFNEEKRKKSLKLKSY